MFSMMSHLICSSLLAFSINQDPPEAPPRTIEIVVPNSPIRPSTAKLAENVRMALCPTMRPDYFAIEYFDKRPSINLEGRGLWRGYRMVFSMKAVVYLSDEDPRPDVIPPEFSIKEYVEIVIFPDDLDLPTNTKNLIPWEGFTSFYHVRPVDMGNGFGFHWYCRMHLWEQDDLRERLQLIGGDDRKALATEGLSINDCGGMTRNSMDCRKDRTKSPTISDNILSK